MKTVFYILCALVAVSVLEAEGASPKRISKSEKFTFFTDKFEVLASDTTVRDGTYTRYYRDQLIEKGRYVRGRRVGTWEFRNDRKMVELRYNYTIGQPLYVLPHEGKAYSQDTYPSLFLGSPLVPTYFILNYSYYPKAEANNKKGGKVVLALHVDAMGRMKGFHIVESTSENFSKVVRQAAMKIPADEWRWAPAMLNGNAIDDYYMITVMFDN